GRALGAEGTAQQGARLGGLGAVAEDEEPEGLTVRPRRRPRGGEEDRGQLLLRHGVGTEAADSPSCPQPLEEADGVRGQGHALSVARASERSERVSAETSSASSGQTARL